MDSRGVGPSCILGGTIAKQAAHANELQRLRRHGALATSVIPVTTAEILAIARHAITTLRNLSLGISSPARNNVVSVTTRNITGFRHSHRNANPRFHQVFLAA